VDSAEEELQGWLKDLAERAKGPPPRQWTETDRDTMQYLNIMFLREITQELFAIRVAYQARNPLP